MNRRGAFPGVVLAMAAALPAAAQVPPVRFELVLVRNTAQPVPVEFTAKEISASVLAETNRVRSLHKLEPLKPLAKLDLAADDQAIYLTMALRAAHESPLKDQKDVRERVEHRGLYPTVVAENVIAMNFTGSREPPTSLAALAAALVAQWMDSPAHRENLLNPEMTHLGCATRRATIPDRAEFFYSVQVFAAF